MAARWVISGYYSTLSKKKKENKALPKDNVFSVIANMEGRKGSERTSEEE